MAAHTKIIDLFGIPACGKTTLARYICDNYWKELQIATLSQLVCEAKKDRNCLWKSFSIRYYLSGLRLRVLAPFDKLHREIPIINWPRHARYYCYAKKYTDYDVVIVDHGDIQDFVSLERGVDLHKDRRFSKACSRYIDQSLSDVYVYCKIAPEVAIKRMQDRGRKSGRIDIMGSMDEKLYAFEGEKKRFDFYAKMLRSKRKLFIELDMNNQTELIARTLIKVIQE